MLTEDRQSGSFDFFDVPSEPYVAGNRTGHRIARELLQAIRRYPKNHSDGEDIVDTVITAACRIIDEEPCAASRASPIGAWRTMPKPRIARDLNEQRPILVSAIDAAIAG